MGRVITLLVRNSFVVVESFKFRSMLTCTVCFKIFLSFFRAIILPYDVGRFDAMISNREVEALEFYGNKAPGTVL